MPDNSIYIYFAHEFLFGQYQASLTTMHVCVQKNSKIVCGPPPTSLPQMKCQSMTKFLMHQSARNLHEAMVQLSHTDSGVH